ncbi:MAG: DUF1080 domain-containing protein [Bacteroidales bacterium]|nr:DUF1080 domain-containing protein [Bacteroidales bacterium]MCF8457762.1 DUF1080 domain-containing protein [Bacteroidales bacterium]
MKTIKTIFQLGLILSMMASCNSIGEKKATTEEKAKSEVSDKVEAPNTLSEAEIADGWVLLFDGKTSENWRGYNKDHFPSGWQIVDGNIQVMGSGKGEAGEGGDILYDKKFKNFELELEWKVSEGGNSGIFYLAREVAEDPVWKSAPEMQILDNAKHPDAKLGKDGNRAAGALYDLIPGNMEVVKPAGEWNKVKVLVYKGTVVHFVNGEQVLEYHLWTDDWKEMVLNSKFKDYPNFLNTAEEGYIVLQDHGDDVWFRNIKIKEL